MKRLHFTKRVKFVLTGWPLTKKLPLRHISSKYPSIFARNIAVLTEDLKNEAERNGGLKSMDSLPGPRIFPFLGNWEHIRTGFLKFHITQLEGAKKYGPMYKDQVFTNRAVVVQDPEICKEIYRADGKLPQRDFSLSFGEFMEERERLQLPKSFIQL